MKPSNQRLIIIIGSFSMAIASVYVLFSLVMPSYRDIQTLRSKRQQAIDLYTTQLDASNKIGGDNGLLRQYTSLAEVQKAFSLMLPLSPEISSLMNDVQSLAYNNSVALNSMSFQYLPLEKQTSAVLRPIGTVRVTAALKGSYEDFKSFIKDIETNLRIIDVNAVRIDGGATSKQPILSYNVVIDSYYQSQ